jgi:hypothetical protein
MDQFDLTNSKKDSVKSERFCVNPTIWDDIKKSSSKRAVYNQNLESSFFNF